MILTVLAAVALLAALTEGQRAALRRGEGVCVGTQVYTLETLPLHLRADTLENAIPDTSQDATVQALEKARVQAVDAMNRANSERDDAKREAATAKASQDATVQALEKAVESNVALSVALKALVPADEKYLERYNVEQLRTIAAVFGETDHGLSKAALIETILDAYAVADGESKDSE